MNKEYQLNYSAPKVAKLKCYRTDTV